MIIGPFLVTDVNDLMEGYRKGKIAYDTWQHTMNQEGVYEIPEEHRLAHMMLHTVGTAVTEPQQRIDRLGWWVYLTTKNTLKRGDLK